MAQANQPPPAPPVPGNLGQITNSFQQLQMELRAGRISREITKFNGDGYKKFRQWLNDIERYRTALNAGDDATLAMCFESLRGSAADFLTRTVQQNPNVTWQQFRALMVGQYSDVSDAHIALQTLRKIKQKPGESIQGFAERIRQLADEAYPNVNLQQALIQNSLVEALIDGVHNDGIAKKLMRNRPQYQNFDQAVTAAVQEQQVNKQFGVRRSGEEPMDISAVRSKPTKSLEDKIDSLVDTMSLLLGPRSEPEPLSAEQEIAQLNAKITRLEHQMQPSSQAKSTARQPQPSFPRKPQGRQHFSQPRTRSAPNFQWTASGEPICHFCKQVGHMIRECGARQPNRNPFQGRRSSPPNQHMGN